MLRQFFQLKGLVTGFAALAALVSVSLPASAAVIQQASFGIVGGFTIPSGTHLGTTDSIFISNDGTIIVSQADTYDLAGLVNFGMRGELKDIPSLSAFTPIADYLSLPSGVSFDLNELYVHSRRGPTPGFIHLVGRGTLFAPGFDPTQALLTWSGTTTDNMTFTFAVHHSAVPEPVPVALLGLGLIGVVAMRRRQLTARV
ncbi:MAG: PEP-CTERM sorting domain-containing protein [Rhodospirillaceae bacterium]